MLTDFKIRLFATLINLDSITLFSLSNLLEMPENPLTATSQKHIKKA